MARTILIHGATGGIGSALARRLVAAGDRVHLTARSPERLEALARELDVGWTAGDVADDTFLSTSAGAAGERLDGLVYAVGSLRLKPLRRLRRAEMAEDFALHAAGAALAVQAALPALQRAENGASVLLLSSVAVEQGFTMHASLGMAKGAVEGLTRALAAELAPSIRVNALAPSLTRTPLSEGLLSSDVTARALAALHPLGRLGEPSDAAAAGAFLLSPDAAWITGQVLGVDGGRGTLRVKG